jgi:dynein heavy chain
MNDEYLKILKRYNYVTPSSYLELIRTFKDVNKTIETESHMKINRLAQGLTIIDKAQVKVKNLQAKIEEEEPKLVELEAVLTEKNDKLKIKLAETNTKREQVQQASEEQNIKVTALEKMNQQIRTEKEETEREKDEALRLAEKLGSKDITEVNS